jgi:TolB protein
MRNFLIFIWFGILIFSGCSRSVSPKELLAYSSLTEGFWQIWITDFNGKKPIPLTTSSFDKRHPVWLEAGKKLMYRSNNGELYVLDLGSKREDKILEKFGQVADPDWSNAVDLLVFTRYSPNLADESEIWTIKLDGSEQRIITKSPGMQYNPAFSLDGQRIVYVSGTGYGSHEIWIMDKNGHNQKRLTHNETGYDILPMWSPDGKKIAYASDKGGNLDIWVMNADGANQNKLTDYEGLDTRPIWSSDGKNILFVTNRSGELQIWMINYLTGLVRQVTYGPGECNDPVSVMVDTDE